MSQQAPKPVRGGADGSQKSEGRQGVGAPPRVARPLLRTGLMRIGLVALGAAFGMGCLLPQEDTLLEDLILRNRPPRIVEDQTTLNRFPNRVLTVGNGPGCRLEFEAVVEDPDIDDSVIARWYVDFDTSPEDRQVPVHEEELPTGQVKRIAAWDVLEVEDNPRFPVGTHVVTLMAFDGDLGTFDGPGKQPPPDPVPGVDGGNPNYSTTFDWFVTVDPAESCS
jgi:hypothetical protein